MTVPALLAEALAILTLQAGYNSAVVLTGAALLGAGAGAIGVFVYLRKRALISDAISHATLPGIALGFLVALALGGSGRSLPALLAGAALSGLMGVLAVQWIRDHTRLPEDTAIGTVLSVFFGLGVVLLSHIQTVPAGGLAGLDSFLLGQTAAMRRDEAELIAAAALVVTLLTLLLFKEFATVSFDPGFGRALGWPVARLDLAMMLLLLAIVSIGLKTVGLVLIIALVIVPPVAARFWTERLGPMVAIAAGFGAASGWLGAGLSALFPDLPAGGVIVLTTFALFTVSLLLAPSRGVAAAALRQLRFRRRVRRHQALLRLAEGRPVVQAASRRRLARSGLVDAAGRPTLRGRAAAGEAWRQQALWDRFLADHPEEALGHPDWAARPVEAALPADLVAELERRIAAGVPVGARPAPGPEGRP